jgi:starch synthase
MGKTSNKSKKSIIRVLFIASEAEPFIKVGGLGDVAGSLPRAIHKISIESNTDTKIDIRLCIPFYKSISILPEKLEQMGILSIPTIGEPFVGEVFSTKLDGVIVYLIKSPVISKDKKIYSLDTRKDGEKFVFFSLACLELCRTLKWKPDVLHANDWHTALAVYKLGIERTKTKFFMNSHSMITLHNLPYMGGGTEKALKEFMVPPISTDELPPWACYQPLPMGLYSADAIVPVSPHYAKELLTPEYAYELSEYFRKIKSKMIGILNGLDYSIWNPQKDNCILVNFSEGTLKERKKNKSSLLKEFGFPENEDTPLLIIISRMDQQKGIDLALDGLRNIADQKWQAIILGSGDPLLEQEAHLLQTDFPDKVRVVLRYDSALAHRMYASGDILLMPSLYEPCGLSQMIAMRYACVPVARATGGLLDSIVPVTDKQIGTGFLFSGKTSEAFSVELLHALSIFTDQIRWKKIQKKAMRQDFSWQKSAEEYIDQYRKLMENKT